MSKFLSKANFFFNEEPNRKVWLFAFLLLVPASLFLRFHFLSNVLMEPHPWRQTQTGITIYYFVKNGINLFDYRSPLNGQLWKFVYEFPLYQALSALLIRATGLGLETAARLVSLAFFFTGAAFLFLLVRKIFNVTIALWALLFYFISPFNVIYSRTCLVDMTTTSLLLGYLYCFLSCDGASGRGFTVRLVAGTLLGILAAVTKVQIWYIPTGFLFAYVFYRALRAQAKSTYVLQLSFLMIQLLFALAWIRWANYIRGSESGFVILKGWFFGHLAHRLEWSRWMAIVIPVARNILHDWMVIPFGLAYLIGREYRGWILALFALIVLPPLVMFNIYQMHDYYWIGQMPFILIIAALGFSKLWQMPHRKFARATLSVVALLFTYKAYKSVVMFQPLFFDYRPAIQTALQLKELTQEDDVIYYPGHEGELHLPLYSERLISTWGGVKADRVDPSIIYFDDGEQQFELLRQYPKVSIEKTQEIYGYRVRPSSGAQSGTLYVTEGKGLAANKTVKWSQVLSVTKCFRNQKIAGPKGQGVVVVEDKFNARLFQLPSKSILNIPAASVCEYEITFLPDTREASKNDVL